MFDSFLKQLIRQQVVARYQWTEFSDDKTFQARGRQSLGQGHSRTHKRDPRSHKVYMLDVWADRAIGVDLEFVQQRKYQPALLRKVGLSPESQSLENFFIQWCAREAAYKCLWPDNADVLLKDFRVESGKIFLNTTQFCYQWSREGKFLLAVAYSNNFSESNCQ